MPPQRGELLRDLRGRESADARLPGHLLRFLEAESDGFSGKIAAPRPWHYAELR